MNRFGLFFVMLLAFLCLTLFNEGIIKILAKLLVEFKKPLLLCRNSLLDDIGCCLQLNLKGTAIKIGKPFKKLQSLN